MKKRCQKVRTAMVLVIASLTLLATQPALASNIAEQAPLGRVTTPEELADAVLLFASPWAGQ